MTEQYGRIHKDYKKGQETGLKEEKPMAKQRPTPEKEQALKNEKPENGSCHKKPRMGGRKCRQASRPRRTHEWQAYFRYTWKWSTRKAQTSLAYIQPIQEVVRLRVRGERVWSSGRERGKPILGFLLRLFWGKCPAGMTYYLKEVRMSWDY